MIEVIVATIARIRPRSQAAEGGQFWLGVDKPLRICGNSRGIQVSNEEFAPRVQRNVPVCRAPDGYGLLRLLKGVRS